jgi:hypothetical protein
MEEELLLLLTQDGPATGNTGVTPDPPEGSGFSEGFSDGFQ